MRAILFLTFIIELNLLINCEQSPNNYYYVTLNGTINTQALNYTTGLLQSPDIVASLIFENNINQTGWANLELQTHSTGTENNQSYFAGYLEGYVTGELIAANWRNMWSTFCPRRPLTCEKISNFFRTNHRFITEQFEKYESTDLYWHHVSLVYKQMEGLHDGYKRWQSENNQTIESEDTFLTHIIMLNFETEINDLTEILSSSSNTLNDDHCSALVKPLEDGSDLLVAHNTWTGYNEMLRIVKKYNFFSFRLLNDSAKPLAGHSVSFTSYPGVIFSMDDYYIISSGLVVQETTIDNNNETLWQNIRADNLVFELVRNLVANRLANSGREWTELFVRHNSGTYNNQFMIVDYKQFSIGTKPQNLSDNLLWIVEQLPGMSTAADVTDVVRRQGYWASYNIAYFRDIFEMSGGYQLEKDYGPYYSYNGAARARIFSRDHTKVMDLTSMYKLMRYNDFKNDPLSKCSVYNSTCNPPYSADLAIASRNDLNEPNGTYYLREWSFHGSGAIDAKVTNAKMAADLEMLAVSGPSDEQQPSFQWSTTLLRNLKHELNPNVFNFGPIYVKWYPNHWQNASDISF